MESIWKTVWKLFGKCKNFLLTNILDIVLLFCAILNWQMECENVAKTFVSDHKIWNTSILSFSWIHFVSMSDSPYFVIIQHWINKMYLTFFWKNCGKNSLCICCNIYSTTFQNKSSKFWLPFLTSLEFENWRKNTEMSLYNCKTKQTENQNARQSSNIQKSECNEIAKQK